MTKYHRILATRLDTLLQSGFKITGVVEPAPPEDMMDISGMKDELRRLMMLRRLQKSIGIAMRRARGMRFFLGRL